jgi:hypothetical protein
VSALSHSGWLARDGSFLAGVAAHTGTNPEALNLGPLPEGVVPGAIKVGARIGAEKMRAVQAGQPDEPHRQHVQVEPGVEIEHGGAGEGAAAQPQETGRPADEPAPARPVPARGGHRGRLPDESPWPEIRGHSALHRSVFRHRFKIGWFRLSHGRGSGISWECWVESGRRPRRDSPFENRGYSHPLRHVEIVYARSPHHC